MEPGNDGRKVVSDTPIESDALLTIAFAFWHSTLLLAADELGIFQALACGPADAATLHTQLGLAREMVTDLLDALIPLGVVERREGIYRNTPAATHFLDPTRLSYIGPWFDMARAATREASLLTTRLRAASDDGASREMHMTRMWTELAAIVTNDRGA